MYGAWFFRNNSKTLKKRGEFSDFPKIPSPPRARNPIVISGMGQNDEVLLCRKTLLMSS